jgi:hypothetical protein
VGGRPIVFGYEGAGGARGVEGEGGETSRSGGVGVAGKREAEEEAKRVAAEAKAERLKVRKVALGEAQKSVLAEFRAKTLLKEELLRRNAELVAEASAIEKGEADDRDEVEVVKEMVDLGESSQVAAGKQKVDEVEGDNDGEDKVDVKRSKGVESRLLTFVGLVSFLYRLVGLAVH